MKIMEIVNNTNLTLVITDRDQEDLTLVFKSKKDVTNLIKKVLIDNVENGDGDFSEVFENIDFGGAFRKYLKKNNIQFLEIRDNNITIDAGEIADKLK